MSEKLFEACRIGDLKTVKELKSGWINVEEDKYEALCLSSKYGHLELVEYFINQGVDHSYGQSGSYGGSSPITALEYAVKTNQLHVVKYLISKGAYKPQREWTDYSLLYISARHGHLDMVKYFVENNSEAYSTCDLSLDLENVCYSPLVVSVENEYYEIIDYLIDRGAKINYEVLGMASVIGNLDLLKHLVHRGGDLCKDTFKVLDEAVYNGHLNIIKYLVSEVPKLVDICNKRHSVFKSVERQHFDIFKALVDIGAKVDIQDCFLESAKKGCLDFIKYFIEQGLTTASMNEKAFLLSVEYKRLEVVEFFIKQGIDVCVKDCEALMLSSDNGSLDIMEKLVEAGVDITINDSEALIYCIKKGHIKVVEYLLEQGADIHKVKEYAIVAIADCKDINILEVFINKGLDFRAYDDYLLRRFSLSGYLEGVKRILETYEDLSLKNKALACAAQSGNLKLVKYLVELGADIHNNRDDALRRSAEYGYVDIVKYLVENGADISIDDNYPLRMSARDGHFEVVKYLVEQGADIYVDDSYVFRICNLKNRRNIFEYLDSLTK